MYRDTMQKLGIKDNMLEPSRTTFHGIVPGLSCVPMGKIRMDVMFGNRDNYRVENLMFEVVDLDSPYHALLGRPALAKFMASTHVAYLKMKMPGPRGAITIIGDYKHSMACATAGSNLAETLIIAEEKKRLKRAVEIAETVATGKSMPGMTNPGGSASFQVARKSRRCLWMRFSRSAMPSSGQVWTPNRKASSSASSMRIGISLHGLLLTCKVCRGSWLSTHYM
jgi:hypothetical protein